LNIPLTVDGFDESDGLLWLRGYRPQRGGLYDYRIRAIAYGEVLRRSLARLDQLTPRQVATLCPDASGDRELADEVLAALRDAWRRSVLRGAQLPHYTLAAPGLFREQRTGDWLVAGVVVDKQRRIEGPPSRSPRGARPRIRRWLTAQTPMGAWRRFKLVGDNWDTVEMGGQTIRALDVGGGAFDPLSFGLGKISGEEGQRWAS